MLLFGSLAVGTLASAAHVAPGKQWAIVNFRDPIAISGQYLMGQFIIVHDDARMARGEPCTSIYRFDSKKGPQEEVLSFMCRPAQRDACERTTFSTIYDQKMGVNTLTEYQFAGDTEGHGVPLR
jgi:hypothetical protein